MSKPVCGDLWGPVCKRQEILPGSNLPAWAWFVSTGWHLCKSSSSSQGLHLPPSRLKRRNSGFRQSLTKAKWQLTASTASQLASPLLGGRRFVITHARVSSLTHHRATLIPAVPRAADTLGCEKSQAKGHPMGWGTAEGMWQLVFGSGGCTSTSHLEKRRTKGTGIS